MRKKKLYLLLLIIVIVVAFVAKSGYWYIYNNNKNVNIRIANCSFTEDSTKIIMYWDNNIIYNNYLHKKDLYKSFDFNSFPGKHTLKLFSNKKTQSKIVYVLPIKFISIDYYDKKQSESNISFLISTSSSYIRIE